MEAENQSTTTSLEVEEPVEALVIFGPDGLALSISTFTDHEMLSFIFNLKKWMKAQQWDLILSLFLNESEQLKLPLLKSELRSNLSMVCYDHYLFYLSYALLQGLHVKSKNQPTSQKAIHMSMKSIELAQQINYIGTSKCDPFEDHGKEKGKRLYLIHSLFAENDHDLIVQYINLGEHQNLAQAMKESIHHHEKALYYIKKTELLEKGAFTEEIFLTEKKLMTLYELIQFIPNLSHKKEKSYKQKLFFISRELTQIRKKIGPENLQTEKVEVDYLESLNDLLDIAQKERNLKKWGPKIREIKKKGLIHRKKKNVFFKTDLPHTRALVSDELRMQMEILGGELEDIKKGNKEEHQEFITKLEKIERKALQLSLNGSFLGSSPTEQSRFLRSPLNSQELKKAYFTLIDYFSKKSLLHLLEKILLSFLELNQVEEALVRLRVFVSFYEPGEESFFIPQFLLANLENLNGNPEPLFLIKKDLETFKEKKKEEKEKVLKEIILFKQEKEKRRVEEEKEVFNHQQNEKEKKKALKQKRLSSLSISEKNEIPFPLQKTRKEEKEEKYKRHEEKKKEAQQPEVENSISYTQEEPLPATEPQEIEQEGALLPAQKKSRLMKKVELQIKEGTWKLNREQIEQYFQRLGCHIQHAKGSHDKVSLPSFTVVSKGEKSFLLSAEWGGILLLPSWEEGRVPHYLRKHILFLRDQFQEPKPF